MEHPVPLFDTQRRESDVRKSRTVQEGPETGLHRGGRIIKRAKDHKKSRTNNEKRPKTTEGLLFQKFFEARAKKAKNVLRDGQPDISGELDSGFKNRPPHFFAFR